MTTGESEAPPLVLRAAHPEDLVAIEAIERRSFSDPWSLSSFASVLGEPPVFFAVATLGERIVGYIVAWFVAGEGEIGNIAVDPPYRGHGTGRRLLEAALDAARSRGVHAIYLEVRESNVAAQGMYERRGFSRVGRRRRYYRRPEEDALILRLGMEPPGAA